MKKISIDSILDLLKEQNNELYGLLMKEMSFTTEDLPNLTEESKVILSLVRLCMGLYVSFLDEQDYTKKLQSGLSETIFEKNMKAIWKQSPNLKEYFDNLRTEISIFFLKKDPENPVVSSFAPIEIDIITLGKLALQLEEQLVDVAGENGFKSLDIDDEIDFVPTTKPSKIVH